MRDWLERGDLSPEALIAGVVANWALWAVSIVVGGGLGLVVGGWRFAFGGLVLGLVVGLWIAARWTRRTEFYDFDDVAPSIVDAIVRSQEAWAAWHTATRLGSGGVLKRGGAGGKLSRVLLVKPDKEGYLKHLAGSFENITADGLASDINRAIERFRNEGVKHIRVYDGPLLNMVIGNPRDKKAWIRVTLMAPFLDAGERPSIMVRRTKHRRAYANLKRAYDDAWRKADVVCQTPEVDRAG